MNAIQVEAVKSHREGNVGYIRIPAFNEETNDGVVTAVKNLRKQIGPALQGYIIDLRDDGGGVLDQAIAVSDDFLDGGEIVSTRGRRPEDTQRYDAKPGDIIVVSAGEYEEAGSFGDVLANACLAKGIGGLVTIGPRI